MLAEQPWHASRIPGITASMEVLAIVGHSPS